jgi:enterochelin esterase-like enzyme
MKPLTIRALLISSLVFIASLAAASQAPRQAKPWPAWQWGPMNWVDPDQTVPQGTEYQTFFSKTIHGEVSYVVYLPPDYQQDKGTRYPVMYYLHGSGGTPRSGARAIAERLDRAIRAGKASPMIVIFVNGLAGNTMYCDTQDGKYPVETVIMKDLIPYVDATYRTLATREGRAVEGFSMGGFGAAHLGFKYPEVFGHISIDAPALLGPSLQGGAPGNAWDRLFPHAMGSDIAYWETNDPFTLLQKNADALRDRTFIRIETHYLVDRNWQAKRADELHELLVKYDIAHELFYLVNVKLHNPGLVMNTMGDACAFSIFASSMTPEPSASKSR